MATSETPNRMPAAAPSMKPWCSSGAPIRGPMMSSVPATSRKRLEGDHARHREARVGAVDGREAEAEQQQADGGEADPDPLAARDRQAEGPLGHDRPAARRRRRGPPGPARAGRRPWRRRGRSRRPTAISMPIANSLEANSALAERSGWRMSTAGAAQAPRCLNRKPTLVVRAQASASRMPRTWVIW